MSDIEKLKQLLNYIRRRLPDEEKIDAAEHNRILNNLVDTLAGIGANVFKGNATLETIPDFPTSKCFYLATKKGNYTHFGDLTINTPLAVISWNGIDWEKHEIEVVVNINVDIDDYIDLSNYAKLTGDNSFVGNQEIIGAFKIGDSRGQLRAVARMIENMKNGQAIVWDDVLNVLKTVATVPDSLKWDNHLFDSYLNQPVKTDSDVQFNSLLSKIFQTKGYTEGINGFFVNELGYIKARSLALTDFLETPELRYNKATVIGEEQWATTGGVIEEILIDGNEIDNKYRIKLKLEEGDINPFFEGDICKGIFNTSTGFRSVFFNIVSSSDEPGFSSGIMDVVMTGYMVPPQRAMTIARIGNLLYDVIDGKTVARYPERQRSMLISAKKGYVQWYDKVDTWDIQAKHIVKHEGECKNAGLPGVPIHAEGYISWGTSVYIKGNVTQIDIDDNIVPEIVFRGEWKEGERYTKNNRVGYKGCLYLCIVQETTTRPKYDNSAWFMEQGNPDFIMTFDSSEGWTFIGDNIDTLITATVTKYNQNMTSDIPLAQFSWTRVSASPDSDIIWNAQHIGFGNTMNLTAKDIPGYGMRKVSFTCTAIIDIDNTISESFAA